MKLPVIESIDSEKIFQTSDFLLESLKEKPRQVLIRRFGLESNKPWVLDRIGKKLGITRERVRQIEVDSFRRLRALKKDASYNEIVDKALLVIDSMGGFCERRLLKEVLKKEITLPERNRLMIILNSSDRIRYKKGTLRMEGFWSRKESSGELTKKVPQAHNFLVKEIKNINQPHFLRDLEEVTKKSAWRDFFSQEVGQKKLEMLLRMSKLVDMNILGEWGLKKWKTISQKSSKERAYLVLKKESKPVHFRDIACLINDYWPEKTTLPQTVHNELIKDSRFILIGRGIYGLTGWGYSSGTVKEIILELFKKKGEPLKRDEIVSYVLEKKKVKKTTVTVTLADKNTFRRTSESEFYLVKR